MNPQTTLIVFLIIGMALMSSCKDDEPIAPDNSENTEEPIEMVDPNISECVTLTGNYPEFIELAPVGDNGSYDPTLAGDPNTGRVWMVFSRVLGRGGSGQVSTHLSYSDDGGITWCYLEEINPSEKVALSDLPEEFATAVSAHWSHEVPSIAYFPEAPVDQRWRMTWHRYLHVDTGIAGSDNRQFANGWIATRTASDPSLLALATEEKLFSAVGYYKTPETEAYNDEIGGKPQVLLHQLHPNLAGAIVFTETGMQAYEGNLYVSLVLGSPSAGNSVILIKLDQNQTWSYVNTLLTPTDAANINGQWTNFSATDLFVQNGQGYMLVSPAADLYEGVLLFKIDLETGILVDEDSNGPDIFYNLPKSNVSGIIQTGVATYDPLSINTGIIFGDAVNDEPQFRLYATGVIPE